MTTPPRRSGFWLACLLIGAGVGAVAARWTQADLPIPKTVIKSPENLSAAFRMVSESAIPAIVAIETKTKARMVEQDTGSSDGADPLQNSPFGDDPIFREFFGQGKGPGQGGRRRFQIPGQHGSGSGFVIDASGVMRGEWRGIKVAGHVDEVLQAVKDLKKPA